MNQTNSTEPDCGPANIVFMSMVDLMTFIIGQPVVLKLMWCSLTSSKTPDILNANLALFHNVQYLISLVHLSILFLLPQKHGKVFDFLFGYVQIGGPMSLSSICMQRYVAVVHPLSYPLLKKYRYSEVCAATVWLFTLSTCLIYIVTQDAPGVSDIFFGAIPSSVMGVMIMLMLQSSVTIVRKLRKSSPGDKTSPAKQKAFSAMQAMMIIGVFFYLPVLIMQRITVQQDYLYKCFTLPSCVFLLSLASVVHPIFVLYTQGKLPCLRQKGQMK